MCQLLVEKRHQTCVLSGIGAYYNRHRHLANKSAITRELWAEASL